MNRLNFLVLVFFITTITYAIAQTKNGVHVNYPIECIDYMGNSTLHDEGCLGEGKRAYIKIRNGCDQKVNISYRYSGSFIPNSFSQRERDENGEYIRKAYIKPGETTQLAFCNTNADGVIQVINVEVSSVDKYTSNNGTNSNSPSYQGTSNSINKVQSSSNSALSEQNQRKNFHQQHVNQNNSRYNTSTESSSQSADYSTSTSNTTVESYTYKPVGKSVDQIRQDYYESIQREQALANMGAQIGTQIGTLLANQRAARERYEAEEEARREAERLQRKAEEDERKRVLNLQNNYIGSLSENCNWPTAWGNSSENRLYYYYIIPRKKSFYYSNIVSIDKLNDGSWPDIYAVRNLIEDYNTEVSKTMLYGYFMSWEEAEESLSELISSAQNSYIQTVEKQLNSNNFNELLFGINQNISTKINNLPDPWSNETSGVKTRKIEDPWATDQDGSIPSPVKEEENKLPDPWSN